MSVVSTATLFVAAKAKDILAIGLDLADRLGVPVTSWQIGDPTRSLFEFVAQRLADQDQVYAEYVKAGFLSTARGDWLRVHAYEVYGVEAEEATFAASTMTLTNTGGGLYVIDRVGDFSARSTISDRTYHNAEAPVTIAPGATVTLAVVADEAGSDSAAGVDEIDQIVTTLVGVEITGSTAATARDAQDPTSLVDQCLASLGALSPDGPPDAYAYVARNSALTGAPDVTRAEPDPDSETGVMTLYVAGASGPVLPSSVALVLDACERWATPNCITPVVENATARAVPVAVTVYGDNLPSELDDLVQAAVTTYLVSSEVRIGGVVARSKIFEAIHRAVPEASRLSIASPATDVQLLTGEAAVAGAITISEAAP